MRSPTLATSHALDGIRSIPIGIDAVRTWALIGTDGSRYESTQPGPWGGHRSNRIYGRLDCAAALRAMRRGGYVSQRVFFATEQDAVAAGYRPCAVCLPAAYAEWKMRSASAAGRNRHL